MEVPIIQNLLTLLEAIQCHFNILSKSESVKIY